MLIRRPLVLAALLACESVPSAPLPSTAPQENGTHLVVTIQKGPRSIVAGGAIELVVAVARDGVDAYGGDVEVSIAPADGFQAAPVTLAALASSGVLSLSVSPARRHGDVPLRIVAISKDRKASGELPLPLLVRGTPGSLDTSFGVGGVFVLGEPSAEATGIAVQPDGKIVLGGRIGTDAAVVRVTADGRLDESFGSTGKARVAIPGLVSTHDVVVGPGGSLVLGGTGSSRAVLARFTSMGRLDAGFGAQGLLVASRQALGRSLVVADGNMYMGGQAAAPAGNGGLQVLRLLPTGELEPNWGASGESLLPPPCPPGTGECAVRAMSPKADGRLTACASRSDGVNVRELFASGAEDRNYDLTIPPNVLSHCSALVNNTTRDLFAAGARDSNAFAIVHLMVPVTGGPLAVDPRFSVTVVPTEAAIGGATGLAIGAFGTLVASADATPGDRPSQMALVRVTADPYKLDATFGGGTGYVTTAIGTASTFSRALALQSDGRAIVAGTNGDMVAVRYWL